MSLRLRSLPDKEDLERLVFEIFRNLFVVYLILQIFNYLVPGYVWFYFNLDRLLYLLIGLGAASLIFYAEALVKSDKTKFERINKCISYAFLGLLLLVAVQSVVPELMLEWARTPLIVVTVAFGVVTFYLNRDELEDVEEEARQGEMEEKRREMEFAEKYPRINQIWGLRWIMRWMHKEGWWYSVGLAVIILLFILFGTFHLGQFMSVDEPKWLYDRVPQFFTALADRDWEQTYINDKPGVLPTLLSGVPLLFLDKNDYGPQTMEILLFYWRLPILLFNAVMLFFIYQFSKNLFDRDFSLLLTSLVALNPVIVGISQIVNPDSTLWSTGFITFLTYLLYLKTNSRKYIFISGVFLGLALLSKYSIGIFYIIFILILIIEYLTTKTSINNLYDRFLNVLLLYAISMLTYGVLFPFTWIKPEQIIIGTIGAPIMAGSLKYFFIFLFLIFFDIIILKGRILNYMRKHRILSHTFKLLYSNLFSLFCYLNLNLFLDYRFFDLDGFIGAYIPHNEYSIIEIFQASSYAIYLTLTLPLLIGMTFFVGYMIIKNSLKDEKNIYNNSFNNNTVPHICVISVILFVLGSSIEGYITGAKYQNLLYPHYAIIATYAYTKFWNLNKMNNKILFIIILLVSVITLSSVMPFYYHYTNELNYKNIVITEAWGYGGYELAQQINKLPNARNATVWVDREGFDGFFVGTSYGRGEIDPFEESVDYLVLTNGGEKIFADALDDWKRGEKYFYAYEAANTPLLEYYNKTSIYQININNNPNNYVKIVKLLD